MPRKKSSQRNSTILRFLRYIFRFYKAPLIIVAVCIVLSAIATSAVNIVLQQLVDDCITPALEAGSDFESIRSTASSILGVMLLIYIVGIAATILYTQIMARVGQGTLKHLRDDMFDKMETLPIKYFDTHAHGDIMSTYTNDVDTIRQFIGQTLPTIVSSALTILTLFLMMIYYSVWLTLLVVLVMLVMEKIVRKLAGDSSRYMTAQQTSLAKEEGYVEEMMEGQKVVKVFNHEKIGEKEFDKLNEQLCSDGVKANASGNLLMPVLSNVGNLLYVLIAIVGCVLVSLNAVNISLVGVKPLTIGIIVSFLSASRQMSNTVGQISNQVAVIAQAMAGCERVFALIDEKSEEDSGYVTLVNAEVDPDGAIREAEKKTGKWAWKHYHKATGTTDYVELKGDVRMENVDFAYVEGRSVLHDITLYAKPGQKIAFVGATGAGKTTITNLINRFYDIPDGKIRYDGININKIKKPDLRRSLGMVLQDVNLFTGTVMDNIRYGKLDATDEECIRAAKLANADDFIRRLPQGYQTLLTNNGSQLSQGQRQLISIARAAVADPPVMILDEATSSIDTRTERLVQEGMDNLMKGRTVFVIAHRLSTVRNSDAIMVLDHGRIIERGSHDDLIRQHGTYYQLYTGAFELE